MTYLSRRRAWALPLLPGLLLSVTVGAAASFLGMHYDAPVMLFALLLGMAFNFLHADSSCQAGVDFASRFILRLGVGLLGIRITIEDLAQVGFAGAAMIAALIALTIATGFVVSPLLGRPWRFALLTGGSVAICGASAALAIAAVIPPSEKMEQNTLFTVMAVTSLSTIAMVTYPLLFQFLGFDDLQQGFLIGATIHDVAQVVGAGFSVSAEAGELATTVKLFRVAMLPVVLIVIVLVLKATKIGGPGPDGQIALLPWFMVLFLTLLIGGSLVDIGALIIAKVELVSRTCLITAIAALGIKTSLRTLSEVGGGHLTVVVIETLVLLALAVAALQMSDLI